MDFLFNTNIQFYLAAYLLGGIPFGLVLAKFVAGVNIREAGSGSIGATNVLRVVKEQNPSLAKKLGAATLLLDALKGLLPLLIGMAFGLSDAVLWTMAVLAVVGHCFSPFLGFEGGKGVATGVGVLLALLPLEALVGLGIWFLVGKALKISSLSSLAGLLGAVAASFVLHPDMGEGMSHAPLLLIAFIIFYKHIPNILRLVRGEERAVV